jgi:hypothetical protein
MIIKSHYPELASEYGRPIDEVVDSEPFSSAKMNCGTGGDIQPPPLLPMYYQDIADWE